MIDNYSYKIKTFWTHQKIVLNFPMQQVKKEELFPLLVYHFDLEKVEYCLQGSCKVLVIAEK